MTKPSEETCCKCGSSDINRRFHTNGDEIRGRSDFGKYDGFYWFSVCDHIHHHCRTCQYSWDGLPLSEEQP